MAESALPSWPEPTPFRRLVEMVLAARWLVLAGACSGLILAWAWIGMTPPQYRAAMTVAPTALLDDQDGPADSRDIQSAPAFVRFLQVLTSVEVAERLADESWVAPALFADDWDAAGGHWRPAGGVGDWVSRTLLGRPGWQPPDSGALAERLGSVLTVEAVGTTAMRRLIVYHRDRDTAVALLAAVYHAGDAVLREAAADRADAYIAYLDRRLGSTAQAEHRRGLADLLALQERHRMLIEAGLPYAAEPVEGPAATPRPVWPNPVLILPLATAAGAFMALLLAHARQGWCGGRA